MCRKFPRVAGAYVEIGYTCASVQRLRDAIAELETLEDQYPTLPKLAQTIRDAVDMLEIEPPT